MMHKIYEDDQIKVLSKKEMFVGDEADFGDTFIDLGLINYGIFANHLKASVREEFWQNAMKQLNKKIDDIHEKYIKPQT